MSNTALPSARTVTRPSLPEPRLLHSLVTSAGLKTPLTSSSPSPPSSRSLSFALLLALVTRMVRSAGLAVMRERGVGTESSPERATIAPASRRTSSLSSPSNLPGVASFSAKKETSEPCSCWLLSFALAWCSWSLLTKAAHLFSARENAASMTSRLDGGVLVPIGRGSLSASFPSSAASPSAGSKRSTASATLASPPPMRPARPVRWVYSSGSNVPSLPCFRGTPN
mmetsp:Transcript_23076/g.45826  ORF Transcript_23076/g.45826 Transcript_23076/m.45826 type:complete len:226 (-) Transcript_23076:534-1211(-)